jgi:acyl carrier protein
MDERVRAIVAQVLGLPPGEVTPETSAETCAAWDSLRHYELILALEGELAVRFSSDKIPTLTTVAAIQDAVKAQRP